MPTRIEPITLPRGDTWLNTLPVKNRDGTPYDLTGASLWLTIKPRHSRDTDDSDALIQMTVGTGITVPAPTTGELAVEITDEQTATLTGRHRRMSTMCNCVKQDEPLRRLAGGDRDPRCDQELSRCRGRRCAL